MIRTILVALMVFSIVLLVFIDTETKHLVRDTSNLKREQQQRMLQLQTDVSDLKQSVDALGVACESRR